MSVDRATVDSARPGRGGGFPAAGQMAHARRDVRPARGGRPVAPGGDGQPPRLAAAEAIAEAK
ncbi:hypothetical protein CA850_19545 [Micromonospora echinospora]|uniref:Uncharacterized protein n=1 Tax=Micromonospora echinospora TaxID=1877 RepID=A0A1C4XVW1_MICEC|nr:hypothetical protein CA850_19545 [Micromonospora echinospora]SCF12639.1 hypothetical protein GA0070618_3388 [Micromonospora echinospora]